MKTGILAEPVLVGRERELEELQRCLDMAVEGKGSTVFVSGEAGSGKTRLVTEFLNRTRKQETTTLTGWCLSNAAVPYFPFFEAFNAYFTEGQEQKMIKPEELEVTAWLMGPDQAEKIGKPQAISPQVWKDQTFVAVAKTLLSISATKPLVLFIDDVHWADSASLALIHYLARATYSEKVLILATFRSEQLTPDEEGRPHPLVETLRQMRREDLVKELKIVPLNHTCVSELAKDMLGGDLQQQFAEKLAKESQGNPLFIVESLRMLHERDGLIQDRNLWRLTNEQFEIPVKIKDIILQRLDLLSHNQRDVLDAASVLGEKFDVEVLASVLGLDSLGTAKNLDVISKKTSLVFFDGESYRFDHARSRDIVYDEISAALKKGYHARVAEKLETVAKGVKLRVSDLAHHFAQAGNEEKAVNYALAAGRDALARWSNTEAAKHFQYVLQKIGNSPKWFNEKLTALEGLGDSYYASDSYSLAVNVFDQLANLQRGPDRLRALRKAMFAAYFLGDMPLLARLTQKAEENATADRLEAARVLHQKARIIGTIQGDNPTQLRIGREALKIFEEEYALSDAAWILFVIGVVSAIERGGADALASALRSIALYDELGDIRSQMEAYLYAAIAFGACGLVEEQDRMFERIIALNEKSKMGDYIHLIPTYAYSSFMGSSQIIQVQREFVQREYLPVSNPTAISKVLKALEYAEKTDSSLYLGLIYELLTVEYAFAGDPVRMEEYFGKLMSLPKSVLEQTFSQQMLKPTLGVYYAAKMEFEKSNQNFKEVLQDAIFSGIKIREIYVRRNFAWALSRQGRIDEVELQREQIKQLCEDLRVGVQELFRQVNIHADLMVLIHPEVNQTFEARLDLVNISRSPGSVVKVENLKVTGLEIVDVSPDCLVGDEIVEFKDKNIGPFEVKTAKLAVKAAKLGVLQLNPKVTYVDDSGETKISSTRAFTINVQPAKPKFEVLPGRVSTGIADVDALLFGGIPERYAVALTSPSTDKRELLIKRFLETGAKAGETTFHVTAEAANTKALAEEYPSNFYLIVCNPQADSMIQNLPNVYKLKGVENLTDIDIALTKAFRNIDTSTIAPRKICIEIVSDVLLQHHAVKTRRWLSALLPTLKSKGFTTLAVIDPAMHPAEETQAVLGLFDGEIGIYEKETPKGTAKLLKVKKMTGQKYLKDEVPLTEE